MRLWRLTRVDRVALDGVGSLKFGGRYSSPGRPIVNFASEAGLAVLVTLRYLEQTPEAFAEEFAMGWTDVDALPERVPDSLSENEKRAFVDDWAATKRSLLAAIQSKVLPEADVILMNPQHSDAASVSPLTTRSFTFAECLHRPPMLEQYRS